MKKCNINFNLLWLGQLVSTLGGSLYAIALDIFVLELTGSTAIMGSVMALVTIPRIVLGPLIGVIVDRYDRKRMIVLCDVISGLAIGIVAVNVKFNLINVAIIIIVEIITAICAAFLQPAIESSIADIVSEDALMNANSKLQMATTGAEIIGSAVGGILLAAVGSTCVFFINAISFLLSAFSEGFMKIPKYKQKTAGRISFKEDFMKGIKYIGSENGLFRLILMSAVFNFIFGIIRVSIIPWFTTTETLGIAKYGLLNALISGGMILGKFLQQRQRW